MAEIKQQQSSSEENVESKADQMEELEEELRKAKRREKDALELVHEAGETFRCQQNEIDQLKLENQRLSELLAITQKQTAEFGFRHRHYSEALSADTNDTLVAELDGSLSMYRGGPSPTPPVGLRTPSPGSVRRLPVTGATAKVLIRGRGLICE